MESDDCQSQSSSLSGSSHISSTLESVRPDYITTKYADAYSFPTKIADSIVRHVGSERLKNSLLCKARFGMTNFTGAGTVEMTTELLQPAFALHGVFMPMQYISMCDSDPRAQKFNLAKRLPGCGHRHWPHFFPNILAYTEAAHIASQDHKDNETKATAIWNSAIVPAAWCIRHLATCPLQGPDFDFSGSPCWEWSQDGNRAGLHCKTLVLFVTWGKFHTWWGTPVVVHENVNSFHIYLVRMFLPDHIIHPIEASPKDSGFPMVSRARTYCVCRHRRKTDLCYDIYRLYKEVAMDLATQCTVRDVVFSSPATVRIEEIDICKLRGIQLRRFIIPMDLDYTLTEAEQRSVKYLDMRYFGLCGQRADQNPDLCYNLTDNAENRVTWSYHSGCIPTLRRNTTRLYFPHLRRCLTTEELLALQGFHNQTVLIAMTANATYTLLQRSLN